MAVGKRVNLAARRNSDDSIPVVLFLLVVAAAGRWKGWMSPRLIGELRSWSYAADALP
jgi:hypothetical protein